MDEHVYLVFYKPYGVLTAFTDEEGRETLKAYIDVPDVYPAGRLDLDSEGLLLLTNDGVLAHRLTDPSFNHSKTYLVQVEGTPNDEAIARLESGVEVKGRKTRRARVMVVPEPDLPPRSKPITPHGPTSWLRIVLYEGKKRQVRHMTAAVGLPTLRLVRVAIGPIGMDTLQPGQWRFLTPAEVEALKPQRPADRRPSSRRLAGQPALPERTVRAKKQSPAEDLPETAGKPAKKPAGKRPPAAKRPSGAKPSRTRTSEKPGGSPGNAQGSRYRSGGRRAPGR